MSYTENAGVFKIFNPIHAGISKTRSGGGDSAPLLTPLPFIQTKLNFVWANTIYEKSLR